MKITTLFISLMCMGTFWASHAMEVSDSTKMGLMLFRMKDAFLVQAASQANEAKALTLLSLPGINVNFKDGEGRTALHYAAELGLTDLAKALVEKGADSTLHDNLGDSALGLAEDNGHQEIVDLLTIKTD